MITPLKGLLTQYRESFGPVFSGPPALAFLPAMTLSSFWIGGELALIIVSLGIPIIVAVLNGATPVQSPDSTQTDRVTGLLNREGLDAALERVFQITAGPSYSSACFVLDLESLTIPTDGPAQVSSDMILQRMANRLESVLREVDHIARIGDARFGICLAPVEQVDLEACIQIAGRIQTATEQPILINGQSFLTSCTIGFCLRKNSPGETSAEWITASVDALSEARRYAPSAIRSYSGEIHRMSRLRNDLRQNALTAMSDGQIQAWFQPQVSTDTGQVSGFEALARWDHPTHGVILPDVFLPILEESGLMERLGQTMVSCALSALSSWDTAGLKIRQVAINFATTELRDPHLVNKVQWELDRFDLKPERLVIEIVESVVADQPDDIVLQNITGLAELGCGIDLDDFGTDQASISAIRRFSVSRIKIDRSFVTRIDRDSAQQQMIGAILSLAERLEIETLAEGVETAGEHTLLSQLGCAHVQGFGIARPMPASETIDWIAAYRGKLLKAPAIGRDVG